jgi:hypothetical protein
MADLSASDIANLFPPPSQAAQTALRDDIAQRGVLYAITFWRGVCIDGRARLDACQELGVSYGTYEFDENADVDDVLDYVLSNNAMGRQMNQSQCAMVAAKCKEHYAEPARLRRLANLPQYAECKTSYTRGAEGPVLAILARKFGVNQDYIARAARLLEEAPDLAAEVEGGDKTIMAAWRDLEARTGPKPKRHARNPRKRRKPKSDPLAPPPLPVLPDIPGEIAALTFERLYELYAQGELSEPEEVADHLLAERRWALEAGEPPDERGWASVQMLKHYVLAVEARYQAGAGTMLEGTVVQRRPLPEPAPEPIADLLTEALHLGYVLGVRAATTRRVAPPTPHFSVGRHVVRSADWRIAGEEEWNAAEPRRRQQRSKR